MPQIVPYYQDIVKPSIENKYIVVRVLTNGLGGYIISNMNRKRLTPEMVEMKASGISYAEIANKFGVSRQRIQQIFSPRMATMEAVSDRAQALCESCGTFDQFGHYHHKVYDFTILNEVDNIIYLCAKCHGELNGEKHFCRNCGKQVFGLAGAHSRRYCNDSCRAAFYSTTHECSNCHKTFTLNANQKIRIRRSKSGCIFCSRKCQGHYLSKGLYKKV